MSEENLEIVRRAIEAVLRTPKPDFDTINVLYHPRSRGGDTVARLAQSESIEAA